MAIGRCPTPRVECPYFGKKPPSKLKGEQSHGCYSDLDHKVPQRLARKTGATALEKAYIMDCPANHQQLCRWEHDEKGHFGDDPLPSPEFMLGALKAAQEAGELPFSKRNRELLEER